MAHGWVYLGLLEGGCWQRAGREFQGSYSPSIILGDEMDLIAFLVLLLEGAFGISANETCHAAGLTQCPV